MNLYCTTDKNNYEVDIPLGFGEYHSVCPVCSHNRKRENQRVKCFSFNRTKGVGKCYHCEANFVLAKEDNRPLHLPMIEPTTKRELIKPNPIYSISWNYIDRYIGNNNRLVNYLYKAFEGIENSRQRIDKVISDYRLCSTLSGETIFLEIDKEFRLRSGQIINYDEQRGKRVKSTDKPQVDWLHNRNEIKPSLESNWSMTQCYFGEHLINDKERDIVIVESPKTAIICSILLPSHIWLATMGMKGLKAEKTLALKGRTISLIPDVNAYEDWEKKAKEIKQETGINLILNPIIQNQATTEERDQGLDIADFMLKRC